MIYEAIRVQQNSPLASQNGENAERAMQPAVMPDLDSTQAVASSPKSEAAVAGREQSAGGNASASAAKHSAETEQEKTARRDGFQGAVPECQCEACRKRRYQDGSNDKRVSCQMPTRMDPVTAGFKVKSHEMEHVRREQMKANKEGDHIVSQSVRIMTDRCEECGRSYVSGGYTRTVTKPDFSEVRILLSPFEDETEKIIGRA